MKSDLKACAAPLLLAVASLLAGCSRSEPATPGVDKGNGDASSSGAVIKLLSSRPDLVTGDDALVELDVPNGADVSAAHVSANGREARIGRHPSGRVLALVKGLTPGRNVIDAHLPNGRAGHLEVVSHPSGGSLFSGEQIGPWPCLPDATDAQCSRPPKIEYWYKPSTQNPPCAQANTPSGCGSYSVYDRQHPPADSAIATTTTDQGKTVRFIVRVETISQDRGQAQIVALFDPSKPWEPWAPQEGWNGKLYNVGGANCGMYHGETAPGDVKGLAAYAIAKGFIGWTTSLSNNENHCSPVLHGESLVMAKEYIVKHYGPVRYSIGQGQSGGSIKAQQVANEWPGVFDGLSVSLSFPDVWSTLQETYDCGLMLNYWHSPHTWSPGVTWTEAQWAATAGHDSISVCAVWNQAFIGILASKSIGQVCNVPADQVYDPVNNPNGERCSLADYMRGQFGLRPPERWGPVEKQIGRGFANRALDNVGVQYGLAALMAGTIDAAQFIDLNQHIGGYDIDLTIVPQREEADPASLPVVQHNGLVDEANNLTMPIIDARAHDHVELHHDYYSAVMRARLDKAHGHHDNHVKWTGPVPLYSDYDPRYGSPLFEVEAFGVMDQWLTAIEADTRDVPLAQKAVDDKPAEAHDKCTDAAGTELPAATCPLLFPYDSSPRVVAGEPLTGDVIKCQLKPLDKADYGSVTFTDAQWTQLQQLYPSGVCDYTKPGVEQQATTPWVDYSAGPGGRPLPFAPLPEGWAGAVFRKG